MVYTITFNPALDYVVKTENLALGQVNRSSDEYLVAGGKGINVSIVLNELGIENTALGFVAGFTGSEIERVLKEKGIKTDFITLEKGNSRINVKIKADAETEINAKGPEITEENIEKLMNKLLNIRESDILVVAGSIPKGIDENIYCKIAEKVNAKLVVDAEKKLLLDTLKFRPFLVKPNHIELGEMFGVEIDSFEDAEKYAKKLIEMGAQNVIVSMAEKGGVFVNKTKCYCLNAPKGQVVNSTGAGDSAVAGFIAGYLETGSFKDAFKKAIASGSASAFSEELANKEEIIKMLTILK